MTKGWLVRSLEELVLRVLYEGGCSAYECAAELRRYEGEAERYVAEIERLLADLAQRAYLVELRAGRYALTPSGSERLAALAEASERARGAA